MSQVDTRYVIELNVDLMPVSENLSACLLPQSSGMVPHRMITVWNWFNTRFLTSNYLLKKNWNPNQGRGTICHDILQGCKIIIFIRIIIRILKCKINTPEIATLETKRKSNSTFFYIAYSINQHFHSYRDVCWVSHHL